VVSQCIGGILNGKSLVAFVDANFAVEIVVESYSLEFVLGDNTILLQFYVRESLI